MSDLMKRLRNPPFGTETSELNLMTAAADEIERLLAAKNSPTSQLVGSDAIAQAVAIERERCARIAEGTAPTFDFQKALADGDDLSYGRNGARIEIAMAIRATKEASNG